MYFTNNFFADSCLMYQYLDELELYTGSERSGQKFFDRPKGCIKPESTKYGHTWKSYLSPTKNREYDPAVGLYKTKLMVDYPHLLYLFKEYASYHFPDFSWSQVTINKMETGCSIKEHIDKVNVGDSVLVAFGDYTGGRTHVENKETKGYDIIDCRQKITIFNGSQLKHKVDEIKNGKRYSLVFYNNKRNKKVNFVD